ncbi:transmembrane protein 88-like [Arapaima gigas]
MREAKARATTELSYLLLRATVYSGESPRITNTRRFWWSSSTQGAREQHAARMCGLDLDPEDGGAEGEEKEQEEEYGAGEHVRMLPPPVAHSNAAAWGARRGPIGCLAWGFGLVLWNTGMALACVLVLTAVFTLVLLPATLLLYAGFLCHSRVLNSPATFCQYVDDNTCSALIILGFVMMSPLVVVAAATFCSVARRLRLFLLFQPIAQARYRSEVWNWGGSVRAWV